jgi:hypothetical protein
VWICIIESDESLTEGREGLVGVMKRVEDVEGHDRGFEDWLW